MIINLGDVGALKALPLGESLLLRGKKRRRVRIEFNVDTPATVYLVRRRGALGEPQFLADLRGYTVIDFVADGDIELQVATENGAQVWFHTPEVDVATVADGAAAMSFAKLHTPRARNHAQELMQYQLEQRMQSFQDQMRAEFNRRLEANPNVHPVTGEILERERDKSTSKNIGDDAEPVGEPDGEAGSVEASGDAGEAEPSE